MAIDAITDLGIDMQLLLTLYRSFLFGLCWLPVLLLTSLRSKILGHKPVVRLVLGGAGMLSPKKQTRLLSALDRMAADDDVRGLLVELRSVPRGFASIQEIRDALRRVQESGKLVLIHTNHIGTRELYLGAAADRIWVSPMSELHLTGIGATIPFYGDALSRLGVGVELLSAGAYKSFGEPYSRAFPTSENREQLGSLLADLQDQAIDAIAAGRQVPADVVERALGESPLSATQAVERGLVDGVAYMDEVRDELKELLDLNRAPLGMRPYRWLTGIVQWMQRLSQETERVPVIHLRGPVVMAEDESGSGPRIAAERVIPVLESLAKDDDCKAVVLAVSSPGGSALASDLIARAIRKLMEKRPVVAWFGDVSASGGYYISAPASEIVATPGTITGSIGVVGGKIVIGDAIARVGIHHETVEAGPDTTMMGPWDRFTDDQRQRFRASLVRVYQRFIQVVSAGRKMPERSVLEVAEGRVWTGRQALDHGLVDHLGGLDTALGRAQSLAGLQHPCNVAHIRFKPSRLRVLQALKRDAQAAPGAILADVWRRTSGVLFSAVWSHPMEPLMVLPWELWDSSD